MTLDSKWSLHTAAPTASVGPAVGIPGPTWYPGAAFAPGLAVAAWTGSCGVFGAGCGFLQPDVEEASGFESGPSLAAWTGFHQPLRKPSRTSVLSVVCVCSCVSQHYGLVPACSHGVFGTGVGNLWPGAAMESGFLSGPAVLVCAGG